MKIVHVGIAGTEYPFGGQESNEPIGVSIAVLLERSDGSYRPLVQATEAVEHPVTGVFTRQSCPADSRQMTSAFFT